MERNTVSNGVIITDILTDQPSFYNGEFVFFMMDPRFVLSDQFDAVH